MSDVGLIGDVVRTSRMTDYGVVPVFGCTVKVSVAEVVTNAWLVSTCVKWWHDNDNGNII